MIADCSGAQLRCQKHPADWAVPESTGLVGEGRAVMNDASTTVRLAIASFAEPHLLDAALVDLLRSGLDTPELCLVGTGRAFHMIVQSPVEFRYDDASGPLRSRPVKPIVPPKEVPQLLATAGTMQRALRLDSAWTVPKSGLLGSAGYSGGLADRLRRHSIALLVSPPSPALHQRSSRILLRHSPHIVQTHEFTAPKPPGV